MLAVGNHVFSFLKLLAKFSYNLLYVSVNENLWKSVDFIQRGGKQVVFTIFLQKTNVEIDLRKYKNQGLKKN